MTKQEIEKIAKVKGQIRGEVFRTDAAFILEKTGEKGLKKVEQEARKLGHPIPYRTAESLGWYPVGLRILSLLAIKQALGWGDKEIRAMGYNAPKISFIIQLLTKYFLSFKKLLEQTPKYWEKHYTVGRLEAYKIDLKKKTFVLRIHDFLAPPLLCTYWLGYFTRIGEFGGKKVLSIKMSKRTAKGDPYTEFTARWE